MLHKNSQKRYYIPKAIYFVTIATQDKFLYFQEEIFCELFVKELALCKKLKQFKLFAFCLLPDHAHLLIQPSDEYNISEIMKSLKENVSRDINYIILNHRYEGDTSTCRLHLRRLINQYQTQFIQKYGPNQNQFSKFQWQKSFYDHIIRNQKDLQNHYQYAVYNYIKHNLSNTWKYTSLNHHDLIDSI